MRYRVDGVLYELVPPPRHLAPAIASRIKVMSNLDIAERRLPQDGRIQLALGGNEVDIRVSTLPTMFGESVVLRILDRTVVQLDLKKLGMPEDTMEHLARDHREAQRHRARDRPDLLGQDDHALRHAQPIEPHRRQDHHHRGAGRVRHRGPDPDPGQPRHRRDLRRLPAVDPAAGPGQDPGGRDPRPRDRRDLDPGVADRPHRLHHPAHQRRPLGDHPAARHGAADLLDHGHGRGRPRPAAGAQDLHQLPHRVHPGPRGLHGAGHDPRAGLDQEVLTTARAARSATTPATRAAWASTSSWS